MRKLTEHSERIPRDLIEGIKLYPSDLSPHTSILLSPDRARPMFHINAESSDVIVAERLANEYEALIQQWIESGQREEL
jgi:hypothetical protein